MTAEENPEDVRIDVLGVGISAVSMELALGRIRHWIDSGAREYVCVTGVHGVMESQRDPALREIHNASGMTTPDGMPLVWAGRRAGASWMSRVYGPDLLLAVLEQAAAEGWRSYFYGGAPGVAEQLSQRMGERFPRLLVAGIFSPPYPPVPGADVEMINEARPDLVWVGLSTPAQERWMAAHRAALDAAVLIGVGAAFDIHAGVLAQAPRWMQRSGLEWAYRLAREPRRLAGRYLQNNPAFLAAILRRPPRMSR
jgi:N-acetylglucosaminyldiphosphoundecaprenol N-acetyl-beta-D-mannosaminyltransferase